jgi:hypothetical protein
MPVDAPLASYLSESEDWMTLYQDQTANIFSLLEER